jgi:hypothetical protein
VLPQIDPLSSTSLTIPLTASDLAGQRLCAVVDPLGKILMTDHTQSFGCLAVPVPTVNAIGPTAAAEGSAGVTLTVTGVGFAPGATVLWNGTPLATTFVSATQLQALVPAAPLADEGSASVTVMDPGDSGSGGQTFTILEAVPTASATVHADASLIHVTVTGTFVDATTEHHAARIFWGDGTSTTLDLGVGRSGSFNASHRYRGKPKKHRQMLVFVLDDEGTMSNTVTLTLSPPPRPRKFR